MTKLSFRFSTEFLSFLEGLKWQCHEIFGIFFHESNKPIAPDKQAKKVLMKGSFFWVKIFTK